MLVKASYLCLRTMLSYLYVYLVWFLIRTCNSLPQQALQHLTSTRTFYLSHVYSNPSVLEDFPHPSLSTLTKNRSRGTQNKNGGDNPKFTRVNRMNGLEKWTKELYLIRKKLLSSVELETVGSFSGIPQSHYALVLEMAKELLYSGIPEQVLSVHPYNNINTYIIIMKYSTGLRALCCLV